MDDLRAANRTYHVAQSHMELLPNYYRWTYGVFRSELRGEVIELGCGAGLGISTYLDRASRVYAVDHDERLLERIRTTMPRKVIAIRADLSADWRELAGLRADAVLLMDVLEHFADDAAFLAEAAKLMKRDGVLAVKVPAQQALYSPMDEASGHYRRYDPEDIHALAAKVGLRVERWTAINRLGALAYRFKNQRKTNFSRSFAPRQLRMINSALPLVRLADLLPISPGLSIAAVLRWR